MTSLCCGYCSTMYEDPRLLPCLHSFCFKCIQSITAKVDIKCPICSTCLCRNEVVQPPVNIKLKKTVEKEKLLAKVTGLTPTQCDSCCNSKAVAYCPDCEDFLCSGCLEAHQVLKMSRSHSFFSFQDAKQLSRETLIDKLPSSKVKLCQYHEQKLNLYCEQCDVPICDQCTLVIHKGHSVGDSYMKKRREIQDSILRMQSCLKISEGSLNNVKEMTQSFESGIETEKAKITQVFDTLRVAINDREKELLTQCDKIASTIRDDLTCSLTSRKKLYKDIEASVAIGLQLQSKLTDGDDIVSYCQLIINRTNELSRRLHVNSLPLKRGNVVVTDFNVADVASTISDLGHVISSSFKPLLVSSLENLKSQSHVQPEVPNLSSVSQLNMSSSSSSKELPLSINAAVVTTPINVGRDPDSALLPWKLSSTKFPPLQHQHVKGTFDATTNIHGINHPRSMAFNKAGDIFVTSQDDFVTVFRKKLPRTRLYFSTEYETEKIGNHGTGPLEFLSPNGIAIDEDLVYVAENEGNRIHVFTTDGAFVRVVGEKDSGLFCNPRDIKIGPDDKIYVADTKNHRVQVFNKDWTLSHKIIDQHPDSDVNSATYRFSPSLPYSVSFDQFGHVHILWDNRKPSISVHNASGKCLRSYGSVLLRRGVSGIAIDSENRSFVIDYDTSLVVYDQDGNECHKIRNFNCPQGIEIASDGKVWVADTNNRRLATLQYHVIFS